jgi:hypothetical protein
MILFHFTRPMDLDRLSLNANALPVTAPESGETHGCWVPQFPPNLPGSIFSLDVQDLANSRRESKLYQAKDELLVTVTSDERARFDSNRWLGSETCHDHPDVELMMPLKSARSQPMVRVATGPMMSCT